MDSVKSKRFSFAGFSSGLSRSLSFSNHAKPKKEDDIQVVSSLTTPQKDQEEVEKQEEERRARRAKKSKSLYIKSFSNTKKVQEIPATKYDASEATQSNSKEIRNTIRRSLSAVLYASPHSTHEDKGANNKLVPVLVTPGLSESVGGILIDDGTKNKVKDNQEKSADKTKQKKKSVEYDNSLQVFSEKEDNKSTTTIIWQGYGYTITKEEQEEVASEMMTEDKDLELHYEKEIWDSYRGLIHPLHLFKESDASQDIIRRGRWAGLSVTELRRYYDNYGSMMLKIRETRMLEQQKSYQTLEKVKNEWIIPDIINNKQDTTAITA